MKILVKLIINGFLLNNFMQRAKLTVEVKQRVVMSWNAMLYLIFILTSRFILGDIHILHIY